MSTKSLNIALISLIVVLIVIGSVFIIVRRGDKDDQNNATMNATNNTTVTNATANTTGNQTSSNSATNSSNNSTTQNSGGLPSLVSSTPVADAELESAPAKVSVTFSRALIDTSTLSVTFGDSVMNLGSVIFSPDKKTMEVAINGGQRGNYRVVYTACTEKNSCTIDAFEFSYGNKVSPTRTPKAM